MIVIGILRSSSVRTLINVILSTLYFIEVEQQLPDWNDFLVDKNNFPALNDETFSQYLNPSLIGPADVGLMDETMDYEVSIQSYYTTC